MSVRIPDNLSQFRPANATIVHAFVATALVIAPACGPADRNFGQEADSYAENGGAAGAASAAGTAGAREDSGGGAGTLGSGGSVGGGAAAGAGGNHAECMTDAQCNDSLACNGAERCVDGSCALGTSPCANADTENCEVVCTEPRTSAASATCEVRGVDKDDDQHRSTLCAQNPGDDCDDNAKSIFPDAPELCDGLDNDCNGKADLFDNLPLSGSHGTLVELSTYGFHPAITWAAEQSRYGIVYANGFRIGFAAMNARGELVAPAKFISESGGQGPKIDWNGEQFGVLWEWGLPYQRPAETDVTLQLLSAEGELVGATTSPSSGGTGDARSLAVLGMSNGWASIWYRNGMPAVSARYGTSLISLTSSASISTFSTPVVAKSANKVLVAWADENGRIRRSLRDGGLINPLDGNVSAKLENSLSSHVVVAGLDSGFAVAWKQDPDTGIADDEQLQYAEIGLNGAFTCGPITLSTPIKALYPTSIASNDQQRVITLHSHTKPGLALVTVGKDCEWGVQKNITADTVSTPLIAAAGQTGFAAIWMQSEGATVLLRRRIFGPKLCD